MKKEKHGYAYPDTIDNIVNDKNEFSKTIWCAGKELHLVKIYNEENTPNWDSLHGKNPVFIHRGKYHGFYGHTA